MSVTEPKKENQKRGKNENKKAHFAKRTDILGGQMGGHFSGLEGVENTPIMHFFHANHPL